MKHATVRRKSRGVAVLEFSLIFGWMVTLFLGTIVIGLNLIRALQIVQLARDAGHMFARNVEFKQNWGKQILKEVGAPLGLNVNSATPSGSVLYLSAISYVDVSTCGMAGKVTLTNPPQPTGECTNFGHWVVTQFQQFGDPAIRASTFVRQGYLTGVQMDSDGKVPCTTSRCDYVTNQNLRVKTESEGTDTERGHYFFLKLRPPDVDTAPGIPAQEHAYIAEAAMRGVVVPGVFANATGNSLSAYAVF